MNYYPAKKNFIAMLLLFALFSLCAIDNVFAALKTETRAENNTKPTHAMTIDRASSKLKKNSKEKKAITTQLNNTDMSDKVRHGSKSSLKKPLSRFNTGRIDKLPSIDSKKSRALRFDWPINGKILKKFSPTHNKGIDIAGKKGQSVKAAEAGRVVYGRQSLIGFGKLLIIKHNAIYLSAYANNSRLLVKEGQTVQKGQVVAEVGKVVNKRSGLHFEIRKNGKPVDPLMLLSK